MPHIVIQNMSVTYPGTKKARETVALHDVNLEIASNQITGIIGYSGCGKTTLLRALAGLIDYEGSIEIDGINAHTMDTQSRNLAFIPQSLVMYPRLTVFDNIAFPLRLRHTKRVKIIQQVKELSAALGIEHCLTRHPAELSGGQLQRVALARALIRKPDLCLLDEPLSNIDPRQRAEARLFIKNTLKAVGTTVVYVTHDIDEAISFSDQLVVMNDGGVEISGTPMEVYHSDTPTVNALMKLSGGQNGL